MLVTLEQLKEIMLSAGKRAELFIEPLNHAMAKYDINTPLRLAAFLSQIAHESGSLHYVEELASGKKYNYRTDLGNTDPVAVKAAGSNPVGPFYKGRGLIQITGFYNYRKCDHALNVNLVDFPALLTEPRLAALSAAWFWDSHGLNELADKEQFEQITKVINGGLNGYQDRLNFYHRAKEVFHV